MNKKNRKSYAIAFGGTYETWSTGERAFAAGTDDDADGEIWIVGTASNAHKFTSRKAAEKVIANHFSEPVYEAHVVAYPV